MDKITIYKDDNNRLFVVNEHSKEMYRMDVYYDLSKLMGDIGDMAKKEIFVDEINVYEKN